MNADLPDLRASEGPQATVPSYLLITPDIVLYNCETSTVALLELTFPLESEHHIQTMTRSRKQNRTKLLAEFDHYRLITIMKQWKLICKSIQNSKVFLTSFSCLLPPKLSFDTLDNAANTCISYPQKKFLAQYSSPQGIYAC